MKDLKEHAENPNYVLHENISGYIVQCRDCGEILISFGNVLTSVNETGFTNLHNALNNIQKEVDLHTIEMHKKQKKVIVATPLENLNLCFDPDDFYNVIELFDQAKLMLEIKNIII
ncbi:MAG: hypothetical protein CL853_07360 [Crocinitomicaceae bacterium]|nr:hypothetical protein [Crocinitomicaceae bacterium]|tara:strand:+ start:2078 stop:2425 length:348 start_codon:yes stop_codon:yes gene_type:complete